MRIVVAVRDRPEGAVVSALELRDELTRRGNHVTVDWGDYDRAWEGADWAFVHSDGMARLRAQQRSYGVRMALLARRPGEVAKLDSRPFQLLVLSSRAGFRNVAWNIPTIILPPLAPPGFWRLCPHRDPNCLCPRTAICRYDHDPQVEYRAPSDRPPPAESLMLVGTEARHGASLVYELARRMPDRRFLIVRSAVNGVPVPPLPNVTAIGPLDRDAMRAAYADVRILLMPGEQTAGRPALEAAASGIPTIAGHSPGARQTLGGLVKWASAARVKDWRKMIQTLDDPTAYRLASENAHRLGETLTRRAQYGVLDSTLAG